MGQKYVQCNMRVIRRVMIVKLMYHDRSVAMKIKL